MVIRIKWGRSIKGALSYNEAKVAKGNAELILASGFSTDIDELSFSQKLRRFTRLNERREKIKTNTVHISLNFPPEEKLSPERMQAIAAEYMDRIGFGGQPYLVYRHTDAHHPHVHIVSNLIQANGKPIYVHNIAKRLSDPARLALEQKYHLIPAQSRKRLHPFQPTPVQLTKAEYSRSETKQTISNIVREVVDNYKFTSLQELNAILRLYNITAYRGAVGSAQYLKGGLTYSILDSSGQRIGNAIKASSIYTSPTLKNLQKKFERNKLKKIPYKKFLQAKLDPAVAGSSQLSHLVQSLAKRDVDSHFERSATGELNDIYFIDSFNRTIFSAQEMGYSIEALSADHRIPSRLTRSQRPGLTAADTPRPDDQQDFHLTISLGLLKNILTADASPSDGSPTAKRKRKKKRNWPC